MKQLNPLLFLLPILLHGCIWGNGCEPGCDCEKRAELYIDVQASADPGSTADDINSATAYFFSPTGRLDSIINLNVNEVIVEGRPIIVNYGENEPPIVVIWSNLNGTEQTSSFVVGSDITDMRLSMGVDAGYALSVGNLYYGIRTMNTDPIQRLPILPQSGRLSITTRGLTNISSIWQDLYYTVETAYSGYNAYANPQREDATLRSGGVISGSRSDFVTSQPLVLTLYPPQFDDDEAIRVRLHQTTATGETVLAEVNMDVEGNLIVPHAGRNTNVLIELDQQGDMVIYVRITNWDVIEQWVDW